MKISSSPDKTTVNSCNPDTLSLKPILYTHYIYNICTKLTTKAKGMLHGKLAILLFTEIVPLYNFSFHLLMVFAELYVKIYTDKMLR